ncbi:hypothetical protein CONPUDRAFT_156682 [Coniophora puteana RWD-64-598 SS2]|uniref:Uncharacterized protein n=1 Tax=Coniophora puteana (strain RWD-64-598) TaxID=741705 RepID=A0A5M3MIW8_CONPW|nr:uncharacterized protein CONPUDRAFT_156682 [Coniophora puteana RWD-64-598 SS2]EIW78724.1 hypothetical protein CONPUDRAFT_156682 [Coniophora puteana RWD-64-598 SS2]
MFQNISIRIWKEIRGALFIHFWHGTLKTAGPLDNLDLWDWNYLGNLEVFKVHGLDIKHNG